MISLYPAQIQAKGNNIVEATIKIVSNGYYSFNLEGGTVLNVTVDVAPCGNCQQSPPHGHTAAPQQKRKANHEQGSAATSGESVQTIQPFHHESTSTSPTAIEQVCHMVYCISGVGTGGGQGGH